MTLREQWQRLKEQDGFEDRCLNCIHLYTDEATHDADCEKWLEPVWNEDAEEWECEKFKRVDIEYD